MGVTSHQGYCSQVNDIFQRRISAFHKAGKAISRLESKCLLGTSWLQPAVSSQAYVYVLHRKSTCDNRRKNVIMPARCTLKISRSHQILCFLAMVTYNILDPDEMGLRCCGTKYMSFQTITILKMWQHFCTVIAWIPRGWGVRRNQVRTGSYLGKYPAMKAQRSKRYTEVYLSRLTKLMHRTWKLYEPWNKMNYQKSKVFCTSHTE